jgi:HAD superfamily hydrolase (TIGR01509 family)
VGDIKAVLFDMGGVIVQLDSLETLLGPSSLTSDKIWNQWILSEAVQQFERGMCKVEQFADRIVDELGLEGSATDFIERFMNFPQGLYPGAVEMVASVPARITTGVLSNTNALHWDAQKDAEVVRSLCERSYLSYAIGLAKPERDIFDYAIADLGVRADQVLFIDDNQINVDGAKTTGMQSGLAKGPAAAEQVLRDFAVIS